MTRGRDNLVLLGIFVIILISLLLLWCALYSRRRRELRSLFSSSQIDGYYGTGTTRFERAMQGVSLGLGLPAPPIRLMDNPSLASMARIGLERVGMFSSTKAEKALRAVPSLGTRTFHLQDDERILVISKDVVEGPFTNREVEALMANEISHVAVGDVIRLTGLFSIRALFFILLITFFGLAFIAVFLLSEAGFQNPLLIGFAAFSLLVLVPYILWYMDVNLVRRSLSIRRHTEILTDSIASKLTHDPGALRDAIEKIDRTGLVYIDYSEADNSPGDWLGLRRPDLSSAMDEYRSLTDDRIRNMEEIEGGRWPIFER